MSTPLLITPCAASQLPIDLLLKADPHLPI